MENLDLGRNSKLACDILMQPKLHMVELFENFGMYGLNPQEVCKSPRKAKTTHNKPRKI